MKMIQSGFKMIMVDKDIFQITFSLFIYLALFLRKKNKQMANIRNLKKDINYVLGDIIEAVYSWEYLNLDKDTKKSEKIIDEAIQVFDDLILEVNQKDVKNKKAHFKNINAKLEKNGRALIEKINKLQNINF